MASKPARKAAAGREPAPRRPAPTYQAETVLQPSTTRYDEPRRRDVAAEQAMAVRFRASMLTIRLALEIQAKCGLVPMSEVRRDALDGHRSLAKDRPRRGDRVPPAAGKVLQGAYDELLGRTACSHCQARSECPVAGAKVLQ